MVILQQVSASSFLSELGRVMLGRSSPTIHAIFSLSCENCPQFFPSENSYLVFKTLL